MKKYLVLMCFCVSCGSESEQATNNVETPDMSPDKGEDLATDLNNQNSNNPDMSTTNPTNNATNNGTNNGTNSNNTNNTDPEFCERITDVTGATRVGPSDAWIDAISSAQNGETIVLEAGTYAVPASGVWIRQSNVRILGGGSAPEEVILDGAYAQTSGGVINISGVSDVVVSNLSIRRSRYHAIHVTGSNTSPAERVQLHQLKISDPGEQAIKVNANGGNEADLGQISCSRIELSPAGREQVMSYESSGLRCYTGGIDIHRAQGWVIRDNFISGFWCSNSFLSEHAIHVWRGARDTLVERNLLVNNARGIGFGLGQPGPGRTYEDDPCGEPAEHYGGLIRNNIIIGDDDALFDSPNGMDLGIGLESACDVAVVHNTVASSQAPFSSIEWRFSPTDAQIINNLVTHNLRPRNDGVAESFGNAENISLDNFLDFAAHDLKLSQTADSLRGSGHASGAQLAPHDYEDRLRPENPDAGAFQE